LSWHNNVGADTPIFKWDALLLTGIEDFSTARGNAATPPLTTHRQRRWQRGDTAVDNADGAQKPREHPAIFQKKSSGHFYCLGRARVTP
jgi:hypothetical protein